MRVQPIQAHLEVWPCKLGLLISQFFKSEFLIFGNGTACDVKCIYFESQNIHFHFRSFLNEEMGICDWNGLKKLRHGIVVIIYSF